MLDESEIFRVVLLLVRIVQDRAVKSQLGCMLSVIIPNSQDALTLRIQPISDRLVETFPFL